NVAMGAPSPNKTPQPPRPIACPGPLARAAAETAFSGPCGRRSGFGARGPRSAYFYRDTTGGALVPDYPPVKRSCERFRLAQRVELQAEDRAAGESGIIG